MTVIFKYVGHSTFTVDVDGIKLILDPFLAPHNPMASLTAGDVDADFMLISHGHQDHICDAAAVAKRTGALVISNAEIITWLRNQGVENGHAMNTGGAYSFPFGRVKMTVAHHSSRLPDGCNGGNPVGLLLQFNDGHDVYFAGDTALTYDMKLIGESGGVVGVNFHVGFLRQDGLLNPDTPLSEIAKHIQYIAQRIGIEHVALGSDFDGAIMPQELGDVAGMPKLVKVLREQGFDHDALHQIAHANWQRVLRKTWK